MRERATALGGVVEAGPLPDGGFRVCARLPLNGSPLTIPGFPLGASVAMVAGLIAVANGGLNLVIATGGPGTGNGVVGAAGALVLGLIAMIESGLLLARARRTG